MQKRQRGKSITKIMRLGESPRVRCNGDDSSEVVVTVAVVAVVEDEDRKTEKPV